MSFKKNRRYTAITTRPIAQTINRSLLVIENVSIIAKTDSISKYKLKAAKQNIIIPKKLNQFKFNTLVRSKFIFELVINP